MSTCREINTKGKFCGKKAVAGRPFCKRHNDDYEKKEAARRAMIDAEPEQKQYVPKYMTSRSSAIDDPSRRVVYRKHVQRNTDASASRVEAMTDLASVRRARLETALKPIKPSF